MKTAALRILAVAVGLVLLTAAYTRMHSSAIMADAAKAFLNSLTPEQRARATFQFVDEERLNWHYIPRVRKGLPLRDMTEEQKQLAHALLAAGLSQRGYIKAVSIMSLDEVLKRMEKGSGPQRDPDGYFFSVFGEPGPTGTWGYRVEGHHISQNFTIVDGKIQDAPSFFGTNPAEIKDGPRKGLRVLGREEDLGRELVQSLTPEQKKVAIVSTDAPKEILTEASRKAALKGQPSGLEASRMTAHQREVFQNLLDEYCYNMPDPVAQMREDQIKKANGNLYFAWAGGEQPGEGHYYRIQSPSFLIEFDDTQDHANHIHSVWRDFNGDFGLDLLKEHYQTSHN
ncbi:MAG TPA: DUF3500 domain-containing protein [Bryobacteraceae bacterium]|nr:DUF3500 domain-containing protein [Bryobacteraceae bacterium]